MAHHSVQINFLKMLILAPEVIDNCATAHLWWVCHCTVCPIFSSLPTICNLFLRFLAYKLSPLLKIRAVIREYGKNSGFTGLWWLAPTGALLFSNVEGCSTLILNYCCPKNCWKPNLGIQNWQGRRNRSYWSEAQGRLKCPTFGGI